MIDYEDNRLKTFEQLIIDRDKYGYPTELLIDLQRGDYNCLNEINLADRNSKYFMEPLLYAVKNSRYATYEVFKYYGEELQKSDLNMVTEILDNQIEVLENTAITDNSTLVIYFARIKPEIILYISDDLKVDGEFVEELCETCNKEAIMYAIKECDISAVLEDNPNLANNPKFMREAIKEDETLLEKASEELKNNYEFINEASKENYEVVGYIINNKEKFGLEAIRGAKETTRELTVRDSKEIIDQMALNSDDRRYSMVARKIEERGENDIHTIRWSTAMAAQSDIVTPEYFKKVLDDSILAMIAIQKDLSVDGTEKVSIDRIQTMVTPTILNKLKEKAITQGLEVDSDLERKMEEYTKFFNNYRARLQEQKRKNLQNNKENKVEPKDIEQIVSNARLPEVIKEEEKTQKGIDNPEPVIEVGGFTDDID